MSWTVSILKKTINLDFDNIKKNINFFMSKGFRRTSIYDYKDYYMISFSKGLGDDGLNIYNKSNGFIIYINLIKSEEVYYQKENRNYFVYLDFDNIIGKELLFIEFIYEYFKEFPEDILWNCDEFFYTKSDINKIYNSKKIDDQWIYNNPETFY